MYCVRTGESPRLIKLIKLRGERVMRKRGFGFHTYLVYVSVAVFSDFARSSAITTIIRLRPIIIKQQQFIMRRCCRLTVLIDNPFSGGGDQLWHPHGGAIRPVGASREHARTEINPAHLPYPSSIVDWPHYRTPPIHRLCVH